MSMQKGQVINRQAYKVELESTKEQLRFFKAFLDGMARVTDKTDKTDYNLGFQQACKTVVEEFQCRFK
jgi:hypothetical protein